MKGIEQLIALGRHGAQGVSQLGAGLLQRALDRVYGEPQLAGALATRRRMTGPAAGHAGPAPQVAPATETTAVDPVDAAPVAAVLPTLAVAERVRTARLVGPHNIVYGLMWLYLYPAQGIARRVLKVTDKHLAKALKQKYFHFSEVPFDPVAGCRPLFDGMYLECRKILNGRGGAVRVKRVPQGKADSHKPPTANAGVRKAVARPPAELSPDPLATAQTVGPAACAAVQGEVYQGIVTWTGRTDRTGPDGASYNTFCLTLNDGEREIPLFGTELERQSAALGIGAGERVRIVFMGKVQTQVPGRDRPAFRNLYQLSRAEES